MKIMTNKEWDEVEQYVLQLKRQKNKAEDRLAELIAENYSLTDELSNIKANTLTTKMELLDINRKLQIENLSTKAVLEECLSLLNQSVGQGKESVSVSSLIDIRA